jgi:hypothetical protein
LKRHENVTCPVLKIKRLAAGKNGCKNCGADNIINLKIHQEKSCLINNIAVRYYMTSLFTGKHDSNINDEKVQAGVQIHFKTYLDEPMEQSQNEQEVKEEENEQIHFDAEIIDQFKNDDQKPQKPIKQESTVQEQKEPQEEEIFEDEDFMGFQKEEIISTSQQNLAKIIEAMRIENVKDVHWTMNDQWREVNGGGLLPALNAQKSNSCTACAVTALCMLHVEPLVDSCRMGQKYNKLIIY